MIGRLFKFDSLIAPSILKFVFYFGVAASVLGALGIISSGLAIMQYQGVLGFTYIIGGLIMTVVGVVLSRVLTEMALVLFMIRDELAWQRQHTNQVADIRIAAE